MTHDFQFNGTNYQIEFHSNVLFLKRGDFPHTYIGCCTYNSLKVSDWYYYGMQVKIERDLNDYCLRLYKLKALL